MLLEGKMTNKQAYIEYKNSHLFKYGSDGDEEVEGLAQRTRSHDHVIEEDDK